MLNIGEGLVISTILEYDVITIEELAQELGSSKKYAYQFIHKNNLKFVRIGKKIYISKKILEEYLKKIMED